NSRATVISNIFFGSIEEKWVFSVLHPLSVDGKSPRVLAISQNADSMASTLSQHLLRGGWHASLLDRDHKVIASTGDDDVVGEPLFLNVKGGQLIEPRYVQRSE